MPAFGHVFIVVGENSGFSSTYDSGAMPYLDSLAAKFGLATNYIADTHPSIGNYFVLTSGQILSNDDSLTPSSQTFSVDNIALDVQNAGKTWKDYIETGNGCGALNSGSYYVRHDPLEFYSNINSANVVCFSQFAADLQNGTLPNLSWLVPNGCDDAHDCSLGTFDSWLQTELGPLLASAYFQPGGDGLLIITFDENEDTSGTGCTTSQIESGSWCGGQVETVIVTPKIVSAGYQSANEYHEENILRLMEEALGLTAFPGASSDSQGALSLPVDMADFFAAAGSGSSGSADFVLTSTPASESISPGSSADYTIRVAPQGGAFNNAVVLSCSGLPADASCSFSPSSVTPGSGTVSAALTISTSSVTAVFTPLKLPIPRAPWFFLSFSGLLVAMLALILTMRKKRIRHFRFAAVILLVFLIASTISCGGSPSSAKGATPAGTFSIAVVGSSGQLQNSTTVTLVVQ